MKKQFLLKSIFILVILTFPLITLSQIRWSWGKNDKGQLGDGTTQNVGIPEKLTDLSGVIDITGGTSHSCALLEDGTVWSWGQGGGTSSLTPVLSPVSNVFRVFGGGLYTLFLLNDGTMDSLGDTPAGPFVTNPVDIAAGGNHILFLLADGTVFAQGKNNFGQLGDGTTTDGFGVVPGLNGVVDIAAGWSFSVAVKDDGTVWTWGENNAGQLGNGTLTESHIPIQVPNISGIIKVACGAKHVLALNSDGNVWAWGFNAAGQLGLGYSSSDVTTPTKISNFNNIKDIFSHCGAIHSGALDNDGNLWLWGYDVDGEIGDGGGASVDSPKKIISGSIFIDNVGLGAYHTMISGWLGLLISPDTLPNAAVGSSYNQALTVQNGTAPYTFSISSGSLPNGMTITPAGVLSGTPTVAGIYSFTVEVVDSASGKGKRDYTLIVNNAGCPNLTITPATVPFGRVGTSYSQYISCTGGTSPYTYSIHSGALPQGLNLSSSGLLSGTPSSSGTYSFTIIVQDGNTCFGSQNYTMTIYEPCATITISPSDLSDGKTGVLYNQTLSASGGTSPYTFTLKSGSLPPGLSVSSTGVISGTPSSGGTFSFTILATDSTGCVGTTQLTLFIYQPCPIITLTTTDLPKATAGNPYTYTLSAQNGTVPYSFSIISGNLPPGLSLSKTGTISGIPTVSGLFNFLIGITDSKKCDASYFITLEVICPTMTLSTATLPIGITTRSYNYALSVVGNSPPYIFSADANLPPGLNITSNGIVSGVPLKDGKYNFLITVVDKWGCSITQNCFIEIVNPPIIYDVKIANDPYRLIVKGTSFYSNGTASSWIYINNLPVPITKFKSVVKLVAREGGLKSMLPKGVRAEIRVKNPDGIISDPYYFTP